MAEKFELPGCQILMAHIGDQIYMKVPSEIMQPTPYKNHSPDSHQPFFLPILKF